MKNTIRLRFAMWTAALLLFTMAVFGSVIFASVARKLFSLLDESLRVTASESIAAMNIESGRMILNDGSLAEIAAARKDRGFALRVVETSTGEVASFGNLPSLSKEALTELLARRAEHYTSSIVGKDGSRLRIFTAPVVEQGQTIGIIQVALPTLSVWKTLDHLLATLALASPVLAVLSALGGYYLARRALSPIERLTRAARNLTAENLGIRLNGSNRNDEVGTLVATFDEMRNRLHESFQREKQFASDVSHALRTPLTALQAILHFLFERERSPDERMTAFRDLDAEVSRLRNVTQQMLVLVRAEQPINSFGTQADLSMILRDLTDSLNPVVSSKNLVLRRQIDDGLRVAGSDDEIMRLFLNLLDNAVKYTEQGSVVVEAVRCDGEVIQVTISDTGIGIPEADLSRVFDRFYRSEHSRKVEGTGLGLPIARRIARAHGGDITVARGGEGGSVFTVMLPAFRERVHGER